MFIFDEDKVIETFCNIDDLIAEFKVFEAKYWLFGNCNKPTRVPRLSDSEIITILVLYPRGFGTGINPVIKRSKIFTNGL